MIKAVAFDLDDTLLLERDYVRSGFRAVAEDLKARVSAERDWFAELWRGFESGVRGVAFDRVLAAAGVEPRPELVAALVRVYREHRPRIQPPPDVAPALGELDLPPGRMGVITDGPVAAQQRKFEALGLSRFFGHVIYTDQWGLEYRKPHPRAFVEFERLAGVPAAACAYVADNPAKDFAAPRGRGWRTVRLRRPGGLHEAEDSVAGQVDRTIDSLGQLRRALFLERPQE